MFPEINVMVKNTRRYLEFINFSLGASGVVRQNLQNSNTALSGGSKQRAARERHGAATRSSVSK